ncbi:hypothetical protein RRG08_053946 [Elysia crispata]|uniref:Uncharacterized protein n=1 Tax=Elysia crispata TaxID=231223 RepID=A0AAE0ZG91_9GAST|nr:hypothetical protein RRG08_053946 [Elysia crispata]
MSCLVFGAKRTISMNQEIRHVSRLQRGFVRLDLEKPQILSRSEGWSHGVKIKFPMGHNRLRTNLLDEANFLSEWAPIRVNALRPLVLCCELYLISAHADRINAAIVFSTC